MSDLTGGRREALLALDDNSEPGTKDEFRRVAPAQVEVRRDFRGGERAKEQRKRRRADASRDDGDPRPRRESGEREPVAERAQKRRLRSFGKVLKGGGDRAVSSYEYLRLTLL